MDICLGIDVGQYSIKIAEIRSGSSGYELLSAQEFLLSKDIKSNRQIEVIDILRKVYEQYTDKDIKIVWGISQNYISHDICYFPFKERHKILKSIAFELEDSLPFSLENAIFDGKIIRFIGERSEVMASACPKERIKQQLDLSSDSLIDVNLMSADGLALANLFMNWQEPPAKDSTSYLPPATYEESLEVESEKEDMRDVKLILNIGHDKTIALFMAKDHIADMRIVDWAGKDLVYFLAHKTQTSFSEALTSLHAFKKIFLTQETCTPHEKDFSDLIKESISDFCQQLRLVILETQSRTQTICKSIYITGGLTKMINLGPVISQNLEIPTNKLSKFYMKPSLDLKGIVTDLNKFTTALGLAIEGFKRIKNPPNNFLKDEFANQNEGFVLFWDKWSHTIKTVTVVFALLLTYSIARSYLGSDIYNSSQDRMRIQTKKITGLKGRKANLRGAKKYIKEQKRIVQNLELAKKIQNLPSALDILKNLSADFPSKGSKVNISEFVLKNNRLKISGRTLSAQTVLEIEKRLKSLSTNKKVLKTKPNLLQKEPGWIYFSLNTQLKPKGI